MWPTKKNGLGHLLSSPRLVSCLAACLLLASSALQPASGQVPFESRITFANRVALTTTNYGFFGNNFQSRTASFEFPMGTGYEHLVSGGLWIGARTLTDAGEAIRVSTGVFDFTTGSGTAGATEFVPVSDILERSRLAGSPFFDPAALSDQDLVCTYSDDPGRTAPRGSEPHVPLGVSVRQTVASWSYSSLSDVVFVNLEMTATRRTLREMYVGMYAELASGAKNAYSCWPPSSTCGGSLGGWYQKALLAWDAPRRLLAEHYCRDIAGCNQQLVPPWVGIKLLGVWPEDVAGKQVGLQIWNWASSDTTRDQDAEKYVLLSSPHQTPADTLPPPTGDPIELLTVGPFALAPSPALDTLTALAVAFAFVGGETYDSMLAIADKAQEVFDQNYVIPPTPTLVSLVSVQADAGRVRLTWYASHGPGAEAQVYRRSEFEDWLAIGRTTSDGSGQLIFEDAAVAGGQRYGYRLGIADGDQEIFAGETWVDVPALPLALHGLRPNPGRSGALSAAFTLAGTAPATLEMFEVSGRLVQRRELKALGPGYHKVRLDPETGVHAGVYLLRLTQGDQVLTARAVVLP